MSYKLNELKGVTPALASSLEALGISDNEQLLLAVADPDALTAMRGKLGISTAMLGALANRADLLRVPGIGPAYTDLLNNAGVNSVTDLRAAGPGLYDQLVKAGETLGIKGLPKPTDVTSWVNSSQSMADADEWAIQTKSDALRTQFADDEWVKVKLAPLAAAALVIGASPSNSWGTEDEMKAAAEAINEARAAARPEALLNVAFPSDVTPDNISDFMGETPRAAMASTIKSATDLVRRSATPAQLATYQEMILGVAQQAAEAAKEGGFLRKKLVSDEEQKAINEIRAAVGA